MSRKPRQKGMRRSHLRAYAASNVHVQNQLDRGNLAYTIAKELPQRAMESAGVPIPITKGLSAGRKAVMAILVALRKAESIVDDFGNVRSIQLDDIHSLHYLGRSCCLTKKLKDEKHLRSVIYSDREMLKKTFVYRYKSITWVDVLSHPA